MKKNELSVKEARKLALYSQGLFDYKKDTLEIIEHLGYVQIDTLSVIVRAHHHTLWSRLPNYREKNIDQLQEKEKSIFEYWSHAASYLPMKDYRFTLPVKKSYSEGKNHWFYQDVEMKKYILDRIKSEGALQSKDFEHKYDKNSGWFEWKPAKKALEQLFMEGLLMIEKRQGFQKVYNLTERVLPPNTDVSFPTLEEYAEYLIKNSIQANGIVLENEITYLRNKLKPSVNKVLKKLLADGELISLNLEGMSEKFVTSPDKLKLLNKLELKDKIHFLSPFDNLIIQRKRVKWLFNFDYIIECYLPESKRKFGYFSLPILYNDNFVGRFDPKSDRDSKTFFIKSIYFEDGFKPDEKFNYLFTLKLKEFASFNGCEKIIIQKSEMLL